MRTLSSPFMFIFKIVFPALWITGFGAGTLTMWIVPSAQTDDLPVLEFTVAWVVGTVLLLSLARGLKVVYLDGEWLWVSNFRRQIPIPLREIESVEEIRWLNIHPIILNLNRKTEFWDRIVFMPQGGGYPLRIPPIGERAGILGRGGSSPWRRVAILATRAVLSRRGSLVLSADDRGRGPLRPWRRARPA